MKIWYLGIGTQGRLKLACAIVHSCQSLHCLHTCGIEADEGLDQNIDGYPH